jgi:hypothetical protein
VVPARALFLCPFESIVTQQWERLMTHEANQPQPEQAAESIGAPIPSIESQPQAVNPTTETNAQDPGQGLVANGVSAIAGEPLAGEPLDSKSLDSKSLDSKALGASGSGAKYRRASGKRTSPERIAVILALRRAGVDVRTIAKTLHCSTETVCAISNGKTVGEGKPLAVDVTKFDPAQAESVKKTLAARWYGITKGALEHITDEKLGSANALQLATVAAIGTDKARLCEGLSTVRVEFQGREDEDLEREVEQLTATLAAWEAGKIQNAQVVANV